MLPTSGFKIGRIFGIDIIINFTWLVIFALVTVSFGDLLRITAGSEIIAGQRVDVVYPGGVWPWVAGVLMATVFFACLLMHELSHSLVARRNGIGIHRITLFIFGGVAEMKEEVGSPGVEFMMAIAGPGMSFLLSGLFFGSYYLADRVGIGLFLTAPLFYLGGINLLVGGFNLLPGYPLDGGRVLRSILWKITGSVKKATHAASMSGQVIGGIIAGAGVYFILIGNFLGGMWFLLIGFFLFKLAQNSYKQTLLRLAAADTTVSDVMYTNIPLIDAGTRLTVLRDSYFRSYHLPAFPVTEGGSLIGIVTRDDLASVSSAEWDLIDAGRISTTLEDDMIVSPETSLEDVLKPMMAGKRFLLVAKDGEVVGVLTRDEVMRYAQSRMERAGD